LVATAGGSGILKLALLNRGRPTGRMERLLRNITGSA
jgi:hypothetical protein